MTKREVVRTALPRGATIAGRYQIERLIGTGGMGSVYEATQLAIGRRVALKLLRPDVADDPLVEARFEREARAAASIRHSNVVIVHDFGRADDGTLFLAMELLEGSSLLVHLRDTGAIPPRRAVAIAREIASALEAAHAAGVVHRDLKPDNVMLLVDGGVKVLDFGIARIVRNDREDAPTAGEDRAQLTDAQQMLGTPRYMSPEAVARLPVGPPADLYALGAILFEMLTGRPVFLEKEPVLLMGQHLRERPPRLRDVAPDLEAPVELETLLDELLRKLPTERPRSATEVRKRLAGLDWGGKLVRDTARPRTSITSADFSTRDDEAARSGTRARRDRDSSAPLPSPEPLSFSFAERPPPPTLTPEPVPFQAPVERPGRADWVTPRRRRRTSALGAVIVVTIVAAFTALLVVHRMRLEAERRRLEADASTTSPAVLPLSSEPLGPRATEALIVVRTNAPEPTVRWDGEPMSGTAFGVSVDGLTHRLEVSARGYAPRRIDVVADGPHTLDVPLEPARARRR